MVTDFLIIGALPILICWEVAISMQRSKYFTKIFYGRYHSAVKWVWGFFEDVTKINYLHTFVANMTENKDRIRLLNFAVEIQIR